MPTLGLLRPPTAADRRPRPTRTIFGQVVILALIQLGGFVVMTFASVVGIAVVRKLSLRSKLTAAAEVKSFGIEDVRTHVLSFDPDSGSIYERLAASGVDIHHATRLLDAVGADADDARLLEVPEGSPLMRLCRRAFTIEGTPIEWSDDRYLPGHARFASTSVRGGANGLSMLQGI